MQDGKQSLEGQKTPAPSMAHSEKTRVEYFAGLLAGFAIGAIAGQRHIFNPALVKKQKDVAAPGAGDDVASPLTAWRESAVSPPRSAADSARAGLEAADDVRSLSGSSTVSLGESRGADDIKPYKPYIPYIDEVPLVKSEDSRVGTREPMEHLAPPTARQPLFELDGNALPSSTPSAECTDTVSLPLKPGSLSYGTSGSYRSLEATETQQTGSASNESDTVSFVLSEYSNGGRGNEDIAAARLLQDTDTGAVCWSGYPSTLSEYGTYSSAFGKESSERTVSGSSLPVTQSLPSSFAREDTAAYSSSSSGESLSGDSGWYSRVGESVQDTSEIAADNSGRAAMIACGDIQYREGGLTFVPGVDPNAECAKTHSPAWLNKPRKAEYDYYQVPLASQKNTGVPVVRAEAPVLPEPRALKAQPASGGMRSASAQRDGNLSEERPFPVSNACELQYDPSQTLCARAGMSAGIQRPAYLPENRGSIGTSASAKARPASTAGNPQHLSPIPEERLLEEASQELPYRDILKKARESVPAPTSPQTTQERKSPSWVQKILSRMCGSNSRTIG